MANAIKKEFQTNAAREIFAVIFFICAIAIHSYAAERAGDLFDRADSAYNKRDFQEAIKLYTKVIGLSPRYTGAYNERTIAYLLQEKHQEATKDAIRACELGDCKVLEYMSRNNLVRD